MIINTQHNVFLITEKPSYEPNDPVYVRLNNWPDTGNSVIKLFGFSNVPLVHTLLSIEDQLKVGVRSEAFVFASKKDWENSQWHKYSFIKLIDSDVKDAILDKPIDKTPRCRVNFLSNIKLSIVFVELELEETDQNNFKLFIEDQRRILEKNNIGVIDVLYRAFIKTYDRVNGNIGNKKVFVVSSNPSTVPPNGWELITPKQFKTWTYQ